MPGAEIAYNQAANPIPYGTPGVARDDIWQAQPVVCKSTLSGNTSYEWSFLDVPPGSGAVLLAANTATATFTPDLLGTYRIQLITNGGGLGNSMVLVIRVRYNSAGVLQNDGICLPAFGERVGEDNVLIPAISGAQNERGYAPFFESFLAYVLTLSGGSGAIEFVPSSPTSIQINAAGVPTTSGTDAVMLGYSDAGGIYGDGAVLLGGYNGALYGNQSAMIAGYECTVTGECAATVAGFECEVTADTAATLGGTYAAASADGAACIGGYGGVADAMWGVVIGWRTTATAGTHDCALVSSNGEQPGFGNGSIQSFGLLTLSGQTPGDAPGESVALVLASSASYWVLEQKSYTVRVDITANDGDGNVASWAFTLSCYSSDGASAVIVGVPGLEDDGLPIVHTSGAAAAWTMDVWASSNYINFIFTDGTSTAQVNVTGSISGAEAGY
jgi:hypothetical protein